MDFLGMIFCSFFIRNRCGCCALCCRGNRDTIIRSYTVTRTFHAFSEIAESLVFACWFKIQISWTRHSNRTCVRACKVMVTRQRVGNFSETSEETRIVALGFRLGDKLLQLNYRKKEDCLVHK